MCREGAWAELTVEVTSVGPFRSAARVKKQSDQSLSGRRTLVIFVVENNKLLYNNH